MRLPFLSQWLLAAAITLLGAFHSAQAQEADACSDGGVPRPPVVNLRVDNDIFGGPSGQRPTWRRRGALV
jgi:hypothetical protein